MATLIVGAGLVGSQIARLLSERGERPVVMDVAAQPEALREIVPLDRITLVAGDALQLDSLTEIVKKYAIERVVHTAANPMLTLGAQRDPWSAIQLNIMGTVNVLEAARRHALKRVVVASSNVLNFFLSGGEDGGDTAREEAFPRPNTYYSATKQALENLGLNYARWGGVDFAAVRYGAVVGPWSGHGGGGPSNIVRSALEQGLIGGEAVVPASALEWVYSKDAAAGTVLALDAGALDTRVFNITMGTIVAPEAFADALREVIPGARVRIETPADSAVALPAMRRVSSLARARAVLGYTPMFDMAGAMRDMVAWLKSRSHPVNGNVS